METQREMQNPDLDAIMKEGLEQFDMNLDEENPPSPPAGPSEPDTEKPGDQDSEPPFRFKTHEEAERGYRDLQRMVTDLSEGKKALSQRLAEVESAKETAAAEEASDQEFLTYSSQRRAQALDEIEALDPDTPEYREEVAKSYARADLDIAKKSRSLYMLPPEQQGSAKREDLPPELDSSPRNEGTAGEESDPRKYVTSFILKPEIGLEEDDPLFWHFASGAPTKDAAGSPMTLDDQIMWAVNQTKQYTSKVLAKHSTNVMEEADRVSASHRIQEMPMGRTGASPPAPGTSSGQTKPVSLSDAIESAQQMRRL